MPFRSGIEMSRMITSGCSSLTLCRVKRPLSASPITSMSACALTSDFNPARMTVWSSAKKMRSEFIGKGFLWHGCWRWDANGQRRAATRLGFNIQLAANQSDTFVNADKPQSTAFFHPQGSFQLESATIVFHNHQQFVIAILQHYTDARCLRML